VSPVKYELGFYIPEDDILNSHRREHIKSYIEYLRWQPWRVLRHYPSNRLRTESRVTRRLESEWLTSESGTSRLLSVDRDGHVPVSEPLTAGAERARTHARTHRRGERCESASAGVQKRDAFSVTLLSCS
jgi:hypothetical protein